MVVARVGRQIEAALFDGDFVQFPCRPTIAGLLVLTRDLRLILAVLVVGEFEENEAEDRGGVLIGLQAGVCAEGIGGFLEMVFKLL